MLVCRFSKVEKSTQRSVVAAPAFVYLVKVPNAAIERTHCRMSIIICTYSKTSTNCVCLYYADRKRRATWRKVKIVLHTNNSQRNNKCAQILIKTHSAIIVECWCGFCQRIIADICCSCVSLRQCGTIRQEIVRLQFISIPISVLKLL